MFQLGLVIFALCLSAGVMAEGSGSSKRPSSSMLTEGSGKIIFKILNKAYNFYRDKFVVIKA